MKILLAVDGSDHTKRMLSYLAAHDELLGAKHEYLMATVVMAISPHAARYLDRKTLDAYYEEEADAVLKPALAFAHQQGWNVRPVHARGHAPVELTAIADREKCDLIVMGTHGHSSLGNLVLGSVATGVLARSSMPVLLVR